MLNYNKNKDHLTTSKLLFCEVNLCDTAQSVRYERREIKKKLREVRRLKTNEELRNFQQLCDKDDSFVGWNGKREKEDGDMECC